MPSLTQTNFFKVCMKNELRYVKKHLPRYEWLQMQSLLIRDDNGRFEALAHNILSKDSTFLNLMCLA